MAVDLESVFGRWQCQQVGSDGLRIFQGQTGMRHKLTLRVEPLKFMKKAVSQRDAGDDIGLASVGANAVKWRRQAAAFGFH
jgi:hypothetical protein